MLDSEAGCPFCGHSANNTSLLWVHSNSDSNIPIELGRRVYAAKTGAKLSIVLNGFDHNAIYEKTPADIWSPIVEFVLGNATVASQR